MALSDNSAELIDGLCLRKDYAGNDTVPQNDSLGHLQHLERHNKGEGRALPDCRVAVS